MREQEHPSSIPVRSVPKNLTVATTGASGSIFLQQLLLAADRDSRVKVVNLIASDSGLRVLAEELGIRGRSNLVGQLLGHSSRKIRQANADRLVGRNFALQGGDFQFRNRKYKGLDSYGP